jgi:hypothetical protein
MTTWSQGQNFLKPFMAFRPSGQVEIDTLVTKSKLFYQAFDPLIYCWSRDRKIRSREK